MNWNIYEGLKIPGLLSVQAGETSDIYGWKKPGCVMFSTGVQFIFCRWMLLIIPGAGFIVPVYHS